MAGFLQLTAEPGNCSCGRNHTTTIKEILVEPGALEHLAGVRERLGLGPRVLLVADANTYEAAGRNCEKLLRAGGCAPRLSLFATTERIVPDEAAREKILKDLPAETDFLVAVGSGTINDLVRYIGFKTGKPFLSVPTAPSMDGYTSVVSPLITNGFKRTYNAIAPLAVYADLKILKAAPAPLLAAGFGDLLGKLTARADWVLSHIVNGEYYCEEVAGRVKEAVTAALVHHRGLASRDEKAVRALMEGLLLTGLAMLWVNASRPASGAEHLLAHFWEMKGLLRKEFKLLHGAAVGVGTWIAGRIYEQVLAMDLGKLDLEQLSAAAPTRDQWETAMRRVYGPLFAEVKAENKDRKFSPEERRAELKRLVETEEEWRRAVREILPAAGEIRNYLQAAGAPSTPVELGVSPEEVREAVRYAKECRRRYTILKVLELTGGVEEFTAAG